MPAGAETVSVTESRPSGPSAVRKFVYWGDETGGVFRIKKAPRDGGPFAVLASGFGQLIETEVRGNALYVTDHTRKQLLRLCTVTGELLMLAEGLLHGPSGIAVWGSNIVWNEYHETSGRIMKVVEATPCLPIEVSMDIKPGSDPNTINLKSRGIVPVAILTDTNFDASAVDAATVRFGRVDGEGAGAVRQAIEDVDGDRDLDLVVHFRVQDIGFQAGDTTGHITGATSGGFAFHGEDSVKIIH